MSININTIHEIHDILLDEEFFQWYCGHFTAYALEEPDSKSKEEIKTDIARLFSPLAQKAKQETYKRKNVKVTATKTKNSAKPEKPVSEKTETETPKTEEPVSSLDSPN